MIAGRILCNDNLFLRPYYAIFAQNMLNMKDTKVFFKWSSVAAMTLMAAMAVSCSNDEEDGGLLSFEVPSVYFSGAGAQTVVPFSATGVERFYISSKPKGWGDDNVVLDAVKKELTIVVPAQSGDGSVELSGTITLNGYNAANKVKSASLFVGVVAEESLEGPANSFIANKKDTHYSFSPVRGDGAEVQPASVGVIWQSASKLLQYVYLDENNRISFYVGADAERTDEIMRGNALIGAYDAAGALLWSWHVWTVPYDPEQDVVEWNGYRLMGRNLGALDQSNATAEERLASYGLFYQWGRKEPFVGPSGYRANNGSSASIYDAKNVSTKLMFVESSEETGTEEYALQHPLSFITSTSASGYDWMWNAAETGWSRKNDPCPHGWRVAPADAFRGLQLEGTPTAADDDLFGWRLTDGAASSLFMAAGRRVYLNGKIQNVYQPEPAPETIAARGNSAEEAQPWVGLYWSADAVDARKSAALYFWYDKKNATGGIAPLVSYARANGLSVRCVKE